MDTEAWGPLQALLTKVEADAGSENDRKQPDLSLCRELNSTEGLGAALTEATVEQVDLALRHDALAVEQKPFCCSLLLETKTAKLRRWQQQQNGQNDAQYSELERSTMAQLSHFFYQVPVSVVMKEMAQVGKLCERYVQMAESRKCFLATVFPLRSLLTRMHGQNSNVLTPLHGHFFHVCVRAKAYFAASNLLQVPILELPDKNSISTVDFMRYAYFGGVLLIGEKRWKEAEEFLLLAVTAPAITLSAFAVVAYKKALLVHFISHGSVLTLPKYTSFPVARIEQTSSGWHEEFVIALSDSCRFNSGMKGQEKAREILRQQKDKVEADGDAGLAKQCLEAVYEHRLRQLHRTFVKLPLAQLPIHLGLASSAGVEDGPGQLKSEKLVTRLVAERRLSASVDRASGVITFETDETTSSDGDLVQLLEGVEMVGSVAQQLRQLDAEFVTSDKFKSSGSSDRSHGMEGGDGEMETAE